MTTATSPARRSRARAQERPPRCEHPKSQDGKPCRRNAGAGTEHPGIGPCALHDDGDWQKVAFAENVEAQEQFLDLVSKATAAGESRGIRELIETLGYRKRDVTELAKTNRDFDERYVEARGYDAETIRIELHRRAMSGSDTLLKFEAEMRLEEAAVLRQRSTRVDGQVDMRLHPVLDYSKLDEHDLAELRRILTKGAPEAKDVPRDARPALELVAGGGET